MTYRRRFGAPQQESAALDFAGATAAFFQGKQDSRQNRIDKLREEGAVIDIQRARQDLKDHQAFADKVKLMTGLDVSTWKAVELWANGARTVLAAQSEAIAAEKARSNQETSTMFNQDITAILGAGGPRNDIAFGVRLDNLRKKYAGTTNPEITQQLEQLQKSFDEDDAFKFDIPVVGSDGKQVYDSDGKPLVKSVKYSMRDMTSLLVDPQMADKTKKFLSASGYSEDMIGAVQSATQKKRAAADSILFPQLQIPQGTNPSSSFGNDAVDQFLTNLTPAPGAPPAATVPGAPTTPGAPQPPPTQVPPTAPPMVQGRPMDVVTGEPMPPEYKPE